MAESDRSSGVKHADEQSVESLSEVFRCFICMERLREAHLCPHCSKLCCFECIRRWLTETREQCPHCRAALYLHELVNCRWVQDVTAQLDSLQLATGSDRCSVHPGERLSVFCSACSRCICHQCALWGGAHSGHAFKPLEEVYTSQASRLRDEAQLLRRRLMELLANGQDVERCVETVRALKDERVREMRAAVEGVVSRLDAALRSRLVPLVAHKSALRRETEQIEALLEDAERLLRNGPRAQLLDRADDIIRRAHAACARPVESVPPPPLPFISELCPNYERGTLLLTDFCALRARGEPVFSPPLMASGLAWRLKVYPDGNGVVRGNYLSVFLELAAGHPESHGLEARYEYRIEMAHREMGKAIVREFASDFEVGECWGYNRFFRLDLLASEGYLAQDMLSLRFEVRPPTYYQSCRDQRAYIEHLLASQAQLAAQVQQLQSRLRERPDGGGLRASFRVTAGPQPAYAIASATNVRAPCSSATALSMLAALGGDCCPLDVAASGSSIASGPSHCLPESSSDSDSELDSDKPACLLGDRDVGSPNKLRCHGEPGSVGGGSSEEDEDELMLLQLFELRDSPSWGARLAAPLPGDSGDTATWPRALHRAAFAAAAAVDEPAQEPPARDQRPEREN